GLRLGLAGGAGRSCPSREVTSETARDRQRGWGFCEGTGLWPGAEGSAPPDPCPICEGSGVTPREACVVDDAPSGDPPTLTRLVSLLGRLTQPERQRLYEELHARYDCRIYR